DRSRAAPAGGRSRGEDLQRPNRGIRRTTGERRQEGRDATFGQARRHRPYRGGVGREIVAEASVHLDVDESWQRPARHSRERLAHADHPRGWRSPIATGRDPRAADRPKRTSPRAVIDGSRIEYVQRWVPADG